jgi:hypothetical protein
MSYEEAYQEAYKEGRKIERMNSVRNYIQLGISKEDILNFNFSEEEQQKLPQILLFYDKNSAIILMV